MDFKTLIKFKKSYLLVLLVISLVLIFYLRIIAGFFQHDEWQNFASLYSLNKNDLGDIFLKSFSPYASHYTPFNKLVFNALFYLFGINYLGYAIVSILFHLIVVLLIFILIFYLTKKISIALISALFFGLNASSFQATAWIIANVNTHGSSIFGLLSLIFLLYFLKKDAKQNILFLASTTLMIISLLFKEITIAFFVFLPLTLLLYSKNLVKKRKIIYCSIILGLGILYFAFRLFMLTTSVPDSEYIVTKDQNLKEIVYNSVTFPAKIFAQSVIPTWQLLEVSRSVSSFLPDSIAGQPGTTEFDQFVENKTLQIIDFLIFLSACITVLFVWKSHTSSSLKKIVLWSFIFTIVSSFIYVLSPGRSGSIPVIDSRNIYFPAIGASIFIATIIYIIAQKKLILAILIFITLIFLHMYWLNDQLKLRTNVGIVRKGILQQLKTEHPNLPEKVVFYISSDTAYYGMSEKVPPFETGLGQALLVWYHSTERFPIYFFKDEFLRSIIDQGYREVDGRGFGYFRDMNLLEGTVKQNNLLPESIISYNYFGDTNILQETTKQIREKLRKVQKDY